MQILDVDGDTEFLTQTVSEERVHGIMKETMAQQMKRGNRKVKDAETLQRNICLAEQRLTERNHMTQWLMKPLLRSKYLRIHAVIALCYIISPAGETLLKTVETHGSGGARLTDDVRHVVFYASVAVGAMMWLGLSRGVPPNLLMAYSQITTVLFSVLAPSLPEHFFDHEGAMVAFLSLNGVLCASRLLFIIWNFNEDFHGGFQVACKRIGVLESLRSVAVMVAVILSHCGLEYLYHQGVLLISLTTLVLLFKAPHCYCSYSLPPTGIFEGIFVRKSFILLLVSEMLNNLTGYSSLTYPDWWVLNGWSTSDIITFSWATLILSAVLVPLIFGLLVKMSVWGPWAMRDFTCMLPPGSLLRALALWEIGYLHHRSKLFAAAVIFSYVIDTLRSASVFASMMSILGNKWYALKGCYLVICLTALCSAASPYVGHAIALRLCNATPFERVTLDKAVGPVGSLGEAIFWAVVPLASLSYLFQLLTLRYFNADILTFRGHGCLLPDGSRTGNCASTVRVSISQLKRMRRAVVSSVPRVKVTAGGPDGAAEGVQIDTEVGSVAAASENPFRRDDVQSHFGASSHHGGTLSRIGSMACSELVSEIEQQIIFNLVDRAASLPPRSPMSSSGRAIGPRLEDDRLSAHAHGQVDFRRSGSNLSSVSDSVLSEDSHQTSSTAPETLERQAHPDFGAICNI